MSQLTLSLGSLQALSQWKVDLGHPDASRIGLLNSMSYIAGFLITPFATWLLDAWGRKWAMRCKSQISARSPSPTSTAC